eukprot:TRINITY_DN19669_c0_g1_i1.p1 TRINITY_DN19669_c0_g1~~TRINITY_DN19669_c0_g1_i1.p1  ORF type:complete len:183 (+),score=47.58 TRINITY_DN19669_c0_g1_i1:47-595(+)
MANPFLVKYKEKAEFNQYWYSPHTIEVLAKEIEANATQVAFLSTPSLYFSLKSKQLKEQSYIFDLDTQFSRKANFVRYDYNHPVDNIDSSLHHSFDCIVIDPPFITEEAWRKYSETAKLLLRDGGKVILSTIRENAPLLKEILQVEPQVFQPSIPNLVYQYAIFTNYTSHHLAQPNPEIPCD